MHIPIWLLAILGIIGILFLTPYRRALIDFFATVWHLAIGAVGRLWDFIRGAGPLTGTPARWIAIILLFIALAIILFIAAIYFITAISIMAVGIATGHWKAALLLLTVLLVWGSLSMLPSIRIFRPLNWISRWIVRTIAVALSVYLAIAVTWTVLGGLSPRLHKSVERSAGNRVEEFSNKLNKSSLKSEPEMGKFARVIEDSQIYNQIGQPVFFVQKGTTVLVKDLDGKKTDEGSEGKTKVMLPNRQGDFQQGNEGWIPTRKLDWNWQSKASSEETREEVKSCQTQTPPPPPTPRWKLYTSFNFCPNRWNEKDLGWQAVATLEPGEYMISASGEYGQMFCDKKGGNPRLIPLTAEGFPRSVNGTPLSEKGAYSLIGRTADNGIFHIGRKTNFRVFEKVDLDLSINTSQNSTKFGTVASKFAGNKGSLQIEIKRKEVS